VDDYYGYDFFYDDPDPLDQATAEPISLSGGQQTAFGMF
jgi:hypothetical protein